MPDLEISGKRIPMEELPSFLDDLNNIPEHLSHLKETIEKWNDGSDLFQLRTSGSTGAPKLISLSKKGMLNSAKMTNDYFGLEKGDPVLLCLSPRYIAGVMMVVRALERDLDLVVVPPSKDPLKDFPEEKDLKFAAMVPMQVDGSLSDPSTRERFQSIDDIIIGGAPVSHDLHQRIKVLSNRCFATYGMTETMTHIAVRKLNGKGSGEAFKTMEGVAIDQDERGCLTIQAPHLFEGELETNDLVDLLDRNVFIWKGRIDRMINSGAVKLIPEVLEKKIEPVLDRRFFITGIPDERLGEKAVMVIEGAPFDPTTQRLFEEHLKEELDRFEVPKEILFHSEFPRTPTGKIDKLAIEEELFSKTRTG